MNNMQGFIALNTYALILMSFIMIVFFSKKRLHQVEDNTYAFLVIITFFTTLFGIILGLLVVPEFHINNFIITIANKVYLSLLFIWTLIITFYTFYVSRIKKGFVLKHIRLFNLIGLLNVLLIFILPIRTEIQNGSALANGPSVMLTYLLIGICYIIMIVLLIMDHKNIKNVKYVPIYSLTILGSLSLVIQVIFPGLNYLINPTLILIVTFMYFTIENPDVKIIEQLTRNKKLIEQSNEDKSNFLFRISQEVRKPIDDIIRVANISINERTKDNKDQGLKYIDNRARSLKTIVNDVLDISKMDTYNIKMINSTYSIYNVFKEITSKYENVINDNIEFRYSISKSIPKVIYGDSVKVKQVLTTIMENAIKHTKEGFVDLQIDGIVKNNVCRLIITIEDSGSGMSLDKVNQLLSIDNELDKDEIKMLDGMNLNLNVATKIARLLGGQIIIKSEEGIGSEFIITIDQQVLNNNDNEEKYIREYSKSLFSKKRILLVTDKKNLLINVSEYLKKYQVDLFTSMYGQDCIDKINEGNYYDLIIMDDEMQPKTGINTLQVLRQIPRFKIPVVIMLDKNKESIKGYYINDGFSDYILLENLSSEIDKIVKKYF